MKHLKTKISRKVVLHVYDLKEGLEYNEKLFCVGLGAFHTGVEIVGEEYAFGFTTDDSTGVYTIAPTSNKEFIFRCSVEMGFIDDKIKDLKELEIIIDNLKEEYTGSSYHILNRNCNHFSNELCLTLSGREIPGWVNRAPWIASLFPCLVPSSLLDIEDGPNYLELFSNASDEEEDPTDSDDSNDDVAYDVWMMRRFPRDNSLKLNTYKQVALDRASNNNKTNSANCDEMRSENDSESSNLSDASSNTATESSHLLSNSSHRLSGTRNGTGRVRSLTLGDVPLPSTTANIGLVSSNAGDLFKLQGGSESNVVDSAIANTSATASTNAARGHALSTPVAIPNSSHATPSLTAPTRARANSLASSEAHWKQQSQKLLIRKLFGPPMPAQSNNKNSSALSRVVGEAVAQEEEKNASVVEPSSSNNNTNSSNASIPRRRRNYGGDSNDESTSPLQATQSTSSSPSAKQQNPAPLLLSSSAPSMTSSPRPRKGVSEAEFLQREGYSSTMSDLFQPAPTATPTTTDNSNNNNNSPPSVANSNTSLPLSASPNSSSKSRALSPRCQSPSITITPSCVKNSPVSPRSRAKRSPRELKEMSFSLSNSNDSELGDGGGSVTTHDSPNSPEFSLNK